MVKNGVIFLFLQFAAVVGDLAAERKKNLDILGKLTSRKPVLDVTKATNTHLVAEEKRYIHMPPHHSSGGRVCVCVCVTQFLVVFAVKERLSRQVGVARE